MRVGRRFPGEVPRVKLGDRRVHIVGINHDLRRDPIVGVNVGDYELLDDELRVPSIAVWESMMSKGKALPTDRNNGRR